MKYIIRECTLDDAEAIHNLNSNDLGYTYPLDKTRENLEKLLNCDTEKIFVATFKDKVIGYVHANDYISIYADPMKNIMGACRWKEYRKSGVGRALMAEVESWAKSSAKGIRLVSGKSRLDAHNFYRGIGYFVSKHQLNFKKMFE